MYHVMITISFVMLIVFRLKKEIIADNLLNGIYKSNLIIFKPSGRSLYLKNKPSTLFITNNLVKTTCFE